MSRNEGAISVLETAWASVTAAIDDGASVEDLLICVAMRTPADDTPTIGRASHLGWFTLPSSDYRVYGLLDSVKAALQHEYSREGKV